LLVAATYELKQITKESEKDEQMILVSCQ